MPKQTKVINEYGRRFLGREQRNNGTKKLVRQGTQASGQPMPGSMRRGRAPRQVRVG